MKSLIGIILIVLIISCEQKNLDKIDITGSWYADLVGGGAYDTLVNYGELYITDTTIEILKKEVVSIPV